MEEPTTSPFLPSPSLKPPLSNSALPSQALGGMASGLGMQNLNSSRQVRLLGEGHCGLPVTCHLPLQRVRSVPFLILISTCILKCDRTRKGSRNALSMSFPMMRWCQELVQFLRFNHDIRKKCFKITFLFYVTKTRFECHGLGTNSLLV